MSKLRELLSRATKEQWKVWYGFADWGRPKSDVITRDGASQYDDVIAELPSVQPYCIGAKPWDLQRSREQSGNAALIVYLHNNAEAIAGLIEAAERFRDDYKAGRSTKTGAKYALFSALSALKD